MTIKMIAAVSKNGVIGKSSTNSIPWNYPEDMKFFRKMTAGTTVIMGRLTFESIGRLLPKRRNIVISRKEVEFEGLETFETLSLATDSTPDSWLIGGSSIYREGLNCADEIYLTLIPEIIKGENLVYFPWINPNDFEISEYIQLENSELKVAKYIRK